MKSLFYFIGVIITLLFFLDLFNILDFRFCIKPKGYCEKPHYTIKEEIYDHVKESIKLNPSPKLDYNY